VPGHLDLPEPLRSRTRRAGGGGGSLPTRGSHRAHAEALTQGLQAVPVRPTAVDAIDPDLVFKFSAASRLPETALGAQGIGILGEDEDWTYFVLLDDRARRQFEQALSAFAASEHGRPLDLSAGLVRAIQTIDGIETYGPQDRLSPDLEAPQGSDTIEAHIRLWPAGNQQESAARVALVTQLVSATDGCEVLASTSRPQTAAIVADVTEAGLTLLAQISAVERITPPIRIAVTGSQIEQAEVHTPSPPQGAPIGVLDDGPSTVNPLIAAVLTASASFPDPARYTWNPPGPHGAAVASLAAFYDFEEHIGVGKALRTAHPIVVARVLEPVLEPVPGPPTTTGPARGTVFHESVEEAIRWLHGRGVRVVSMSVNRNIAAQPGAPRDELTFVVDVLARELDMVIVLSAGNTSATLYGDHLLGRHVADDYPSYLFEPDAGIAEPGLAANALTIGGESRSDISGWPRYRGIAPTNGPSPYTRTGSNSGSGRVKPDLVHWAGNWGWNDHLRHVAVSDPSLSVIVAANQPGQTFDWTCGTSFAAPRVAHIAAEVLTRYPEISANLARALVLLSARQPEGLQALIPDRGERRRIGGAGRPDPDRAVSCGGNRVVLTFEGEIDCDATAVHPVPIPVEYTQGRRRRRIRAAVACDPPVRRTRREYLAGHLQVVMLRAMSQDEVLEVFRRQPSAQARQQDPTLSAVPLPQDRRRLDLRPGSNDVARTTAYVSEFSTVQLQEDDGDTYYIAVTHQKSLWQNLTDYERQRYAIAVELIDEGEPAVDLYNLVRARVQGRIRPRLR